MIKVKDTIKPIMLSMALSLSTQTMAKLTEAEAIDLVKEAYIWGYPVVDNYRIQYSYFVNKNDPEYKGDWNQLHNIARVYTPKDVALQTPNSDTPYSFLGADLRTEPLVLSVPKIENDRYYSIQFIDMHTYNFAYVGSRTTGNEAGNFLLVGPNWNGKKPANIKEVIRSDSELAFLIYRTQLFSNKDLDQVKAIQKEYKVTPLSKFLGQQAPKPASPINFIKPLTVAEEKVSPEFFNILNFALQYTHPTPIEEKLLQRYAVLGIKPGQKFDINKLDPVVQAAIPKGMEAAWQAFEYRKKNVLEKGKMSSADAFGTRKFIGDRYLDLMMGTVLGIYGNSKEEAIYPAYYIDSNKEPLNGNNNYELTFPSGQLPPVKAFWSLTLYKSPESLLYANSINRYLINSRMKDQLLKNEDGSITLYIQNEEPKGSKKANWLPAPKGNFSLILRLYRPDQSALNGSWKQPPLINTSK